MERKWQVTGFNILCWFVCTLSIDNSLPLSRVCRNTSRSCWRRLQLFRVHPGHAFLTRWKENGQNTRQKMITCGTRYCGRNWTHLEISIRLLPKCHPRERTHARTHARKHALTHSHLHPPKIGYTVWFWCWYVCGGGELFRIPFFPPEHSSRRGLCHGIGTINYFGSQLGIIRNNNSIGFVLSV